MAALVPTIKDNEFLNWLKGVLAMAIAKNGLDDFITDELTSFQQDLLASIFRNKALPAGTVCNSCTTENVLDCPTLNFCSKGLRCHLHDATNQNKNPNKPCPKNLCRDIRDGIRREHRFNVPSWKNTKADKWCTDAFEIAKCFMPPDDFFYVATLQDTDFNCTLAVIINNKRFQNKMAAQLNQSNNICIEARGVGRMICHSPGLTLTDMELKQYMDILKKLLSDPKCLANDQKAQAAVDNLNRLEAGVLSISTKDITTALDCAVKEMDEQVKGELATEKDQTLEKIRLEYLQVFENVKSSIANLQIVRAESLADISAECKSAIDAIRMVAEKIKHELKTIRSSPEKTKKDKGNLPKEILMMDRDSIDLYKKALQEGKVSVHNIRVMVVGHYDVGKTTLTKRLLGEPVDITKRDSTNGIDVHVDRCKISLKDGAWILSKTDTTRKAAFHQLAKLFDKDGQQAETPWNAKEEALDGSCMGVDKVNEQTTAPEHPVAETRKDSGIQTVSGVSSLRPVDEEYAQNMMHLKKFIENVQVDEEDLGTSDLSLWDFAGQNVFYATHQVFFSRRAIYLLVTNMSKHINDTVDDDPWHYDCKGEAKCKIAEHIDFWLNSIHEFCSYPGESGPPVVLVGTFADQLTKEISPQDAGSTLREFLVEKAASCHLTKENFLLDNSVEDENIQCLRKHIFDAASQQDYWGEDIPAKWVTLEDILIGLKEENLKVLHKDRLTELNKSLLAPIESDEELELFLHFQHEMGNIIYFSKDDLTNYILLDPQWLIDAFKSVITAKSFCLSGTNIGKEWMEFERTAVLKPGLIDVVWEKLEDNDYRKYRGLLLTYMEILGLVARPVQQEKQSTKKRKVEEWYFVPCMLKAPPPEKVTSCCDSPHCKSTSKLCYATAKEPDRRFLPTTVFNKLLAACLQRWSLSRQNGKYMIFCGGAIFDLKDNHFLNIFFYEQVIQIWITRLSLDGQFPDMSMCTEAKDNIEYILKTNIRMCSKIIPFVKCPRAVLYSNENMLQLEDTEEVSSTEIVCYCQDKEHVVRYDDLTKYWSYGQDSDHAMGLENDQNSHLTEKYFSKIASRIGMEYLQLGWNLGLTKENLDHIQLDNRTTQDRIVAMLCEWKKQMPDKATVCELKRALTAIGKDASSVLR